MTQLLGMGYEVVCVGEGNVKDFIADPIQNLTEFNGATNAEKAIEHSNMPEVIEDAKRVSQLIDDHHIQNINIQRPSIQLINDYLAQGYLLCHWVNSRALSGLEGYNGHYVLVYDTTKERIIFHNPGGYDADMNPLNHNKGQAISPSMFLKASVLPKTQRFEGFVAVKPQLN